MHRTDVNIYNQQLQLMIKTVDSHAQLTENRKSVN